MWREDYSFPLVPDTLKRVFTSGYNGMVTETIIYLSYDETDIASLLHALIKTVIPSSLYVG